MSDKVVPIHDRISVSGHAPNEAIINRLEDMLAKARRGELRAFGVAYVMDGIDKDVQTGVHTSYIAEPGMTLSLGYAIASLQHRYFKDEE